MYSIDFSGYIPTQKAKEFKQQMNQLIGQHSPELNNLSVMQDMINEDLFLVKVQFKDQESMLSFMNSKEYAIISGSFQTLGLLREKSFIEYSDLKD